MHNFKELKVWQESMGFAKVIFVITQPFPNEEKFGLVTQMRRCAVSIPSNIAEGSGRSSDKEFSHFLDIALGSSYELETQILLSFDFGFITHENLQNLLVTISTIQRMLNGLREKIRSKLNNTVTIK